MKKQAFSREEVINLKKSKAMKARKQKKLEMVKILAGVFTKESLPEVPQKKPTEDTQTIGETKEKVIEDVLSIALRTVGAADRGKDYGHPLDNFQMEADLMNVWLQNKYKRNDFRHMSELLKGQLATPPVFYQMSVPGLDWQDIAIQAIFKKICREICGPGKRDNIIDTAGYAWCYDEARQEWERRRMKATS